jgi:hypothetical protein
MRAHVWLTVRPTSALNERSLSDKLLIGRAYKNFAYRDEPGRPMRRIYKWISLISYFVKLRNFVRRSNFLIICLRNVLNLTNIQFLLKKLLISRKESNRTSTQYSPFHKMCVSVPPFVIVIEKSVRNSSESEFRIWILTVLGSTIGQSFPYRLYLNLKIILWLALTWQVDFSC